MSERPLESPDPEQVVTTTPYRGGVEFYANAVRVDPGVCWRFVSRGDGYRKGSPTGCPEPVGWMGRTMIGAKRYRVYSCGGHVDDLEDVRPLK